MSALPLSEIDDGQVNHVCDRLRTAPRPLFGARAFDLACDEAIHLIQNLYRSLSVTVENAHRVESTARSELERCLPGYTWPDASTSVPAPVSATAEPLAKFQASAAVREAEVTAQLDASDRHLLETKRILEPGIAMLKELESRMSNTEGVSFSYGVAGHMASVALTTSVSIHRLTLETDTSLRVVVEEYQSFTFDSSDPFEGKKWFSSLNEAVTYIAEACGRHIGERAALKKRPAPPPQTDDGA